MVSRSVGSIRAFGCAAADLAHVALGKTDMYLTAFEKPWDVAAGALLVEKAGGIVTEVSGKPWNVFSPNILAANATLHTKLLQLINPPASSTVRGVSRERTSA